MMVGFLNTLASMALGNKASGAAHVSLPSRFEVVAPHVFEAPEEPQEAGLAQNLTPTPTSGPSSAADAAGSSSAIRAAQVQPHPPKRNRREGPSSQKQPAAYGAVPTGALQRPDASAHFAQSPPALTRDKDAERSRIPSEGAIAIKAARSPLPGAAISRSAPLATETVASRIGPSTSQRTDVHVTIDRIEVRSPVPAKSTAPATKPKRGASSVSLSDYLKRNGARP
jgi:hypothetical protein